MLMVSGGEAFGRWLGWDEVMRVGLPQRHQWLRNEPKSILLPTNVPVSGILLLQQKASQLHKRAEGHDKCSAQRRKQSPGREQRRWRPHLTGAALATTGSPGHSEWSATFADGQIFPSCNGISVAFGDSWSSQRNVIGERTAHRHGAPSHRS